MDFAAKAAFLRVSHEDDSEEEVAEDELYDGLGELQEEEKAPVRPAGFSGPKANSIAVQLKTKKRIPVLSSIEPKEEAKERKFAASTKMSKVAAPSLPMHNRAAPAKPVPARPVPAKAVSARPAVPKAGKKWKQEVDTNVVEVPLSALSSDIAVSTGDPVFCQECRALLNACSPLQPAMEPGHFVWPCEFCGAVNQVVLETEEIPHDKKLKYIVEAAATGAHAAGDTASIIFCTDVSGSMCVTQPAKVALKLKTQKVDEEMLRLQREFGEGFVPKSGGRTYVSRLECVQAAIEAQLQELVKQQPDRHVGLVTFNEEVTVYGDCSSEVIIAGDRLQSAEGCLGTVRGRHAQLLGRPIRETSDTIVNKLYSLNTSGQTALGPALLASVELAKQGTAGSKVIICTDGIANVGLGSMESEAARASAQNFYEELGRTAQTSEVTVSVVSIEGEECQLSGLLPIVELTGGTVSKVDPQHLAEDFSNILAARLIASNVNVTVLLHKALKFRNADPAWLQQRGSRMVRTMGNVTDADLLIFEYTFKSAEERQAEGIDITNLTSVPFQVRIEYTCPEGPKCVFAHTEVQPITTNKQEAMQHANFDILAKNGQVRSAALAQEGDYEQAMVNAQVWKKALVKNSVNGSQVRSVQRYVTESSPLYAALQSEKMEELGAVEEDDDDQLSDVKKMKRRAKTKDVVTVVAHKMKKKY